MFLSTSDNNKLYGKVNSYKKLLMQIISWLDVLNLKYGNWFKVFSTQATRRDTDKRNN
jgi:hypothetical protein